MADKTAEELAHEYGKYVRGFGADNDGDDQSVKADAGKPLAGCLLEFPQALNAFADVCTYGAKRYGRGNWRQVHVQRYIDAFVRHILDLGEDCRNIDEQSGMPHICHVLWNAAAIIELTDWEV